jgi:hypothetical protein
MSLGALDLDSWLQTIRTEYDDLPCLRLTLAQAQRLWGLDARGCRALLDALVDVHFLVRSDADGAYLKAQQEVSPVRSAKVPAENPA